MIRIAIKRSNLEESYNPTRIGSLLMYNGKLMQVKNTKQDMTSETMVVVLEDIRDLALEEIE